MSLLLAPIYSQGAPPPPGNVALVDQSVSGWQVAEFLIANDGNLYSKINNTAPGGILLGPWINPQVGMNLYECRASQIGTRRANGIYDTWLDCGNSWDWSTDLGIGGTFHRATSNISFLLEIRRKSDAVVVASCTVSLEADGPES